MKDKADEYAVIMEKYAAYVAKEKPVLDTPLAVASLMRPLLRDREQEEMHVLLLDSKNRMIASERVTVGLVDRSQAHAREVFRAAIRRNCSKVILIHNHPSGDPTPSEKDIACTRSLVEAGRVVGIEVLDHIVLGQRTGNRPVDYLSMREQQLM